MSLVLKDKCVCMTFYGSQGYALCHYSSLCSLQVCMRQSIVIVLCSYTVIHFFIGCIERYCLKVTMVTVFCQPQFLCTEMQ